MLNGRDHILRTRHAACWVVLLLMSRLELQLPAVFWCKQSFRPSNCPPERRTEPAPRRPKWLPPGLLGYGSEHLQTHLKHLLKGKRVSPEQKG